MTRNVVIGFYQNKKCTFTHLKIKIYLKINTKAQSTKSQHCWVFKSLLSATKVNLQLTWGVMASRHVTCP